MVTSKLLRGSGPLLIPSVHVGLRLWKEPVVHNCVSSPQASLAVADALFSRRELPKMLS